MIAGFGGDHGKSYRMRQINGKSIPRTYYGDHLKLNKPQEGYLGTRFEVELSSFQKIRLGRTKSTKLRSLGDFVKKQWVLILLR